MTPHRCRFAVAVSLAVLALLGGCARRPALSQASAPAPAGAGAAPAPGPAPVTPAPPPTAAPAAPARPLVPAPTPPAPPAPVPVLAPKEFRPIAELQDVHFDFDKYDIRPDAVRVLDANGAWLNSNSEYLVLIEGHCDERGTNEYNLALGERRARAAMTYLVSKGVAASRISIVSYGEERPLCTEHNEACWARNRRAHFLVKGQ